MVNSCTLPLLVAVVVATALAEETKLQSCMAKIQEAIDANHDNAYSTAYDAMVAAQEEGEQKSYCQKKSAEDRKQCGRDDPKTKKAWRAWIEMVCKHGQPYAKDLCTKPIYKVWKDTTCFDWPSLD